MCQGRHRGGADSCGYYEEVMILPIGSRYQPRIPISVGPGFTYFRELRTSEVRGIFGPGSYPRASWYGKSVC